MDDFDDTPVNATFEQPYDDAELSHFHPIETETTLALEDNASTSQMPKDWICDQETRKDWSANQFVSLAAMLEPTPIREPPHAAQAPRFPRMVEGLPPISKEEFQSNAARNHGYQTPLNFSTREILGDVIGVASTTDSRSSAMPAHTSSRPIVSQFAPISPHRHFRSGSISLHGSPTAWISSHVKQYIEINKDKDVLLGRGARSNKNPGNERFHHEKELLAPSYNSARSSAVKTRISSALVEIVEGYGGRFVEEDDVGWYVVHPHRARTKASQALRDAKLSKQQRQAKAKRYASARAVTDSQGSVSDEKIRPQSV